MKNVIGILVGITLNVYVNLDRMHILIIFFHPGAQDIFLFVQFLSSVSYSFQYVSLSYFWLNLLLVFFFFDSIVNGILNIYIYFIISI